MRPYILAETNWEAMKTQRFELAILPWGATEAHNYHLPYAADNIESDFIAAESARLAWEKGAKVIVLPTIPYGVNTGQRDVYLDMNILPTTQLAILGDIVQVLGHHGLNKLLILNSHGGNDFKALVRELGFKHPNMFISFANWYQALDRSAYFENKCDHADEMETSLLLHLRPDLLLPFGKWGSGKAKKNKIKEFSQGWAWAERKWPQVTEDTGVGDPRLATAEKGERFFRDLTEKIGNLMVAICNADMNDLYE